MVLFNPFPPNWRPGCTRRSAPWARGDIALNSLLDKLKSNLEEVRSRGGELYVFADRDAGFANEPGVQVLAMPHAPEVLQPVIYTVALQLLSYHVALHKGTDVDKPRNLAKSVTVE